MTRDLIRLRENLAAILPGGSAITGITPFSTGHSNETYLIEGLDQILRLPPSSAPLMPGSHGVIAQAHIYAAMAQLAEGPPVPEVLFVCDDPAVLGDPFFVMARVAGEEINDYQPQSFFADASAAERGATCQTWMRTFADLATRPPIGALGPVVAPEDEARRWRAFAQAADCAPLFACFDQLLEMPAPRSGAPTPAHGDPKLANLMWSHGKLAAVLDWELAYNGDPLADLGYMLFYFASDFHSANRGCGYDGMWQRDQIIAHWADATGRPADGLLWHEIAAVGKMSAIIAYGHYLYVSGKSDDARFLQWKIPLDKNLVIMAAMLRSLNA